jgi:hypothetical protein
LARSTLSGLFYAVQGQGAGSRDIVFAKENRQAMQALPVFSCRSARLGACRIKSLGMRNQVGLCAAVFILIGGGDLVADGIMAGGDMRQDAALGLALQFCKRTGAVE